jgi:hypothetical protein
MQVRFQSSYFTKTVRARAGFLLIEAIKSERNLCAIFHRVLPVRYFEHA